MSDLRRDLAAAAQSLASAIARLSLEDEASEWEVVASEPAAGFWAGEVLSGRLDYPEASEKIAVRSSIYVVLRRSPHLLCRGRRAFPFLLVMELVREFLEDPLELGGLVFSRIAASEEEQTDFLALPVLAHSSGFLLALPIGTLSEELLARGNQGGQDAQVGPSFTTTVAGLEEDEAGIMQDSPHQVPCLVVDMKEEMATYLRKLDPVTDPVESQPFLADLPTVVPQHSALVTASKAWLSSETGERLAFYSASEEPPPPQRAQAAGRAKRVTTAQLASQIVGIAEALPNLTAQLQQLADRQSSLEQKFTAVPEVAPKAYQQRFVPPRPKTHSEQMLRALGSSLGPPPRLREPGAQIGLGAPAATAAQVPVDTEEDLEAPAPQGRLADAILQQSQALTMLVGHLAEGGVDSSALSQGTALGTRGAAKRERLQAELAARSGDFLLQVSQAAFRRMSPTSPLPRTLESMRDAGPLFTRYVERYGGFAGQREAGMMMWVLAHIGDCMLANDHEGAQEMLALALVAQEQSALDSGSWSVAYLLTLLEEPPPQLFSGRAAAGNSARLKAFAPLCPPSWGTTTLAFIKEIDALQARRKELAQSPSKAAASSQEAQDEVPPKRKPRFPRRPKQPAT
ncbi:NaCP60E [Symbiodinium sp. CCMP2592]|nr:NaCP60E [Symbiodinium sp. CCMP2592]